VPKPPAVELQSSLLGEVAELFGVDVLGLPSRGLGEVFEEGRDTGADLDKAEMGS